MMIMRGFSGRPAAWFFAMATALLISMLVTQAEEMAYYKGLRTNEFLKEWLVLSPLPVGPGATNADEALQKNAFDADSLSGAGGESSVQPIEGALKDSSGKVIRATHRQGGKIIEAPKID